MACQDNSDTRKIESSVLLLVEGKDDKNFFEAFIGHLSSHLEIPRIQVWNCKGKKKLIGFLPALKKMPGFSKVKSLGIILDADASAANTRRSVHDSLQRADLQIPSHPSGPPSKADADLPATSVFILPDNKNPGMLETLLCKSFANDPVNNCIDNFFHCVSNCNISSSKRDRQDRARVHAYLATRPEPHVSVGVAAQKGYWNFEDNDDSIFSEIKGFIQNLKPRVLKSD